MANRNREQWKSQFGFIMAAVGSAIGLGNIWRFPYMAYENGGGAFLIPYLVALLTAGIPLLILEFGIGHERIGSAPLAFRKYHKQWEWLGWWAVIFVMFGIELYYNVIISWCANYFTLAFTKGWGSDPGNYFTNSFLNITKSPFELGNIQIHIVIALAVIWFVNWFIVYRGIKKGIELANKIFMPLLLILISILVFWTMTLDGAMDGLKTYFTPDFSKLTNPKIWIDAYGQIFFSLSLGFGIMIAYASYLPKNANITRAGILTALLNSGFSLFAGIAVFNVLGFMANSIAVKEGITFVEAIKKVVSHGPSLAFVTYPKALNLLPSIGTVFGVLFFLSLIVAGLSSSVSIIEAFVSAMVDKFNFNRKKLVTIISFLGFLGGIVFTTGGGLFWLDIVDHFLTQYGLVLVGLFECIVVGWFFKINVLRNHINGISTFRLGKWWNEMIKIFVPLVLMLIIGGAFFNEIAKPYGNYSWTSLILIGVLWLIITIIAAVMVGSKQWRTNIDNHKTRVDYTAN